MIRFAGVGAALLIGLATACGGDEQPGDAVTSDSVTAADDRQEGPPPAEATTVPVESIAMPALPEARRNFLVATSAGGEHDLSGEWEARAAICDDPAVLQVLAEQPGFGTLLLFQLPEGDRVGTYPIAFAETGAPPPPAAQIGVQLFREGGAFAYQAAEGEIEVTEFDSRVTGRFGVTLREIMSGSLVKFAGVFDNVVLAPLPDEQCRVMKEALFPPDSTSVAQP